MYGFYNYCILGTFYSLLITTFCVFMFIVTVKCLMLSSVCVLSPQVANFYAVVLEFLKSCRALLYFIIWLKQESVCW